MSMPDTAWRSRRLQRQIDQFHRLNGRQVLSWVASEMALRESGANGSPDFEDPSIPFLQLSVLQLELDDGALIGIQTHQSNKEWSLYLRSLSSPLDPSTEGIFRTRRLDDFPVGRVSDVDVTLSEDRNIRSVRLRLGEDQIALVAGEVFEQWDGSLRLVLGDESVLLFRHADDFHQVKWWRPPQPISPTSERFQRVRTPEALRDLEQEIAEVAYFEIDQVEFLDVTDEKTFTSSDANELVSALGYSPSQAQWRELNPKMARDFLIFNIGHDLAYPSSASRPVNECTILADKLLDLLGNPSRVLVCHNKKSPNQSNYAYNPIRLDWTFSEPYLLLSAGRATLCTFLAED